MADGDAPSPSPTRSSTSDEKSKAAERLSQITSHVSQSSASVEPTPNTSRRRSRRKSDENELPANYSDILGQISTLQKIASTPNPNHRGYVRQKKAGKLWVRERVDLILDKGTFREVGSVSGEVNWKKTGEAREEIVDYTPSNNVQGFGKMKGRTVVFTADDYSLRAGHADGALKAKTVYMEKLALALKLPMIKLVDGASGGGSVTTIKKEGWSYIPSVEALPYAAQQLNEGIPNLGAVLGPAIGLGAARVVMCHFAVMAGDIGSLFNAGPNVVAGATFEEGLSFTELGGPSMHCTNGTIDNLAANEAECFEQMRTVLSFLPNCGRQVPPTIQSDDPIDRTSPDLSTIIPRNLNRMYDPRRIITEVVDRDSWFEIGALWGLTAIVGLARLAGCPVGIISLNCEVNAGAIDAAGSQKCTRHLRFCDIFNIPVLQFVDCPGYAIGTVAERTATMRHGIALATAYYTTTMPIFNVITRRAYGVAGGVMARCRNPPMNVAWPSGNWGSLPLNGGIDVGHRFELSEIERTEGVEARKEKYRELDEEYRRLMNPVRTANSFGVEEIIDPAVTRSVVCTWTRHLYDIVLPQRVADRASGRLNPVFG
ncbi:propionyl-CoA carboxylase [Rhizodiscina lignyota]|uniref:Propionyl-CoA carboxylase n=1 Tax=Rhizodiscina lignyota TaxID=1504668 RepID=A0A9P4IEM0_9PEZI|nr:propionyl-CoA carboxylase [Rhizodiscina lignyota]